MDARKADGNGILRTQAWDFYAIVAAQRLTVINFYLGIATALTGGQLALLQTTQYSNAAGGLGVLLVVLSFVFWKWDSRSSDLIKLAEDILAYFEAQIAADLGGDDPRALLFAREQRFTLQKKETTRRSLRYYFTYRTCLNILYSVFSIIGASVVLVVVFS